MMARKLTQIVNARPSSDGDGVKIRRIAGRAAMAAMNPFLLLDEIRSEEGADYVGGFPSHPHRGFETITYMLDGAMRHRDHMGNEGVIASGDVQWMTAGRGVIHSEMPEQEDGLLHGFQLWLNLPAARKMDPAAYQEIKRQRLCANRDFAPYSAFMRLDRDANESISVKELLNFLRDNREYTFSDDDCALLVKYFDSDNDNRLTFQE